MRTLHQLNLPEDLKDLPLKQLQVLVKELKQEMVNLAHQKAVHFSSNLGVVELTLALSVVFDPLQDNIVFDTGHQSYIYKMLTKRLNQMHTIRDFNGLSGFQSPSESAYDKFSAGHAATALSACLGISAVDQQHFTIAVIGDGALVSGLALEALDSAVVLNQPVLIIINDNDMSISKNLGGVHNALVRASYDPKNNLFTQFGFTYIGPVDGHDLASLLNVLKQAKTKILQTHESIILHIKTKKGADIVNDEKGFYHSYQYTKNTDEKIQKSNGYFLAQHCINLLKIKTEWKNQLMFVSPSMSYSTGFDFLQRAVKQNFIDLGIQEENAITIAAGIASKKKLPVVITYATFIQRSYDQLVHDVSRQNLPLILLLDRADLSAGDGSSHMGTFDVGMLKSIPHTLIASGMTKEQNAQLFDWMIQNNQNQIMTLRYAASPVSVAEETTNLINCFLVKDKSWQILQHDKDNQVCFISYGTQYATIFEQLKYLKHVSFVNALFLHDYALDNLEWLKNQKFQKIVVYERINGENGLAFDLIKYFYSQKKLVQIKTMHYTTFIEHGKLTELDKMYNMDLCDIVSELTQNN